MLPRKPLSFTTNRCFHILKSALMFVINAKYRLQSLTIASKNILFYIVFYTKRTKKRYLLVYQVKKEY